MNYLERILRYQKKDFGVNMFLFYQSLKEHRTHQFRVAHAIQQTPHPPILVQHYF